MNQKSLLLLSLLGTSLSVQALPMEGKSSWAGQQGHRVTDRTEEHSIARERMSALQRSEDKRLVEAEQVRDTWIAQKEIAIATQSDSSKNPTEEARVAHEARVSLLNQGNSIYADAKGSVDASDVHQFTKVARAYWRAAEEAEQIENIWTLRQAKNANKTAFGVSIHNSKHEQLDKNLKEGIRWARLTPEQRRSELTGEKDSYPEVDRLWKEAQEAWEYKAAARWAAEHQEEILQRVAAILEEEQQAFDQKNPQKTMLGKVSSSFDKATEVLQYVSIAQMSPAVVPKAIAIITDVINRRIQKSSLKEAHRDVNVQTELAEQLREEAVSAEKIALERTSIAQHAEERAAKSVLENVRKLQEVFSSPSSEVNGSRLAAIKNNDSIWKEGAHAVWKERISASEEALIKLQQEGSSFQPALDLSEEARERAQTARSKAVADQERVTQVEEVTKEQEEALATLRGELNALEDQMRRNDAATLATLRTQYQEKEGEAATLYNAIQESMRLLKQAQEATKASEQEAVSLEQVYREKFDAYFHEKTLFERKVQRAKTRLHAEKEAYKQVWPEEAAKNELGKEEAVGVEERTQAASVPTIVAFENDAPSESSKELLEQTPLLLESLRVSEEVLPANMEYQNDREGEPSISEIADDDEENLKSVLAGQTFLRRIAAAQAWQDFKKGVRKEMPTLKTIPLEEGDKEGHILADLEDEYRIILIDEQNRANEIAEAAYWNKRSGKEAAVEDQETLPSELWSSMDHENRANITHETLGKVAIAARVERDESVNSYYALKESYRRGEPVPEKKPAKTAVSTENEFDQDHQDSVRRAAKIEAANRALDRANAAREEYRKKKAEAAAKKK